MLVAFLAHYFTVLFTADVLLPNSVLEQKCPCPSLASQSHCPVLSVLVELIFAIFTDLTLESFLVFHHMNCM